MGIHVADLGFLYAKAIIGGKRFIIKSVVGDSKPQRFGDLDTYIKEGEDNIKVRIGTEDFFVSDLAINQSDIIHHSLKGDRFNSDATETVLKALLGMSKISGNDEIIISGLPVSHYTKFKSNIEKLFLDTSGKTHNYETVINNIPSNGHVRFSKGKFVPQPFGVLLDKLLDDKGQIKDKVLASKRIGVVDIGFGTTDIYVADSLTPIDRLSFSLPRAMNTAYRLIGDKIEEKFGVSLQLHVLESITREGAFKSRGQIYPIENLVVWAYKNVAQQLVTEITNKWGDAIYEIDIILLSGGGGIALADWILPEFPNIELLEDSQWCVVNGYSKWGVRQFGKKE